MAYNTKIQLGLYEYKNSHFIKQAIIDDYYEISFTRNLYQAGDFTITINKNIPNANLFKRGLFVRFGNDNYDMGEIISISDSVGAEGKASQTVIITGKDLRYLFHRRVIKEDNANGKWEMTGKGEIVLRSLVYAQCGNGTESKRRLPIENTIPVDADAIGDECSVSESFTNLYEVLTTIATQTNTGWRVKFDNGSLILECYSGIDRSNNVFFTVSHDALQEGSFVDSSESFANTVYVGGKGQGDERDIYEGENGSPENMDRFEAWDDQSSMTDESEYEAEAGAMLTQYGQTINVSGNALAKSPYIYKEQYDVGDIVTIGFSEQKAVTQILSVTENWSGKGQYAISFEFGKPLVTLNNQLQLMLRQIRKASDSSSSTDSVRWYTIPTDTEMPKADVTFKTIGFIGDCGQNGSTFKLYFDENGTGSKSYHVWFKQLGGGELTLTTGVAGKQNLVMNSGTYVAIIYVDQEGNVLNQASAVSVNSGEQAVGDASTITINGKTYNVGGGGSDAGVPLGTWASFEDDFAPNSEWVESGTTFDADTYPALAMMLGGNTVPSRFDHSRLGDYQDITLPTSWASAMTMQYDGVLMVKALNRQRNIYINNVIIASASPVSDIDGSGTVEFRKGDKIHLTNWYNGCAKVAYYTHPLFIKATPTSSDSDYEGTLNAIRTYVQNSNSYSTTETPTGGTWIDGKPTYKRVFTSGFNQGNQSILDDNAIYDHIVNQGGFYKLGTQEFPVNNNRSSDRITLYVNKSTHKLEYLKDSNITEGNIFIWIEYTKTTDPTP